MSSLLGHIETAFWSGIPLAGCWLLMGLSTNAMMVHFSSFGQGLFVSMSITTVGNAFETTLICGH